MKNISKFLFVFLLIGGVSLFAQSNDQDILMKISNDPVTVKEFMTVFKKNNSRQGEPLDKAALKEYLDLYVIFRLKVKEAKELGIDTTQAFINELNGYRKTLAKPYLTDKDAIDRLVKEAYERMKLDIRSSHILAKLDEEPSNADTLAAYTRIMAVKNFLMGKSIAAQAKKYEEMVNKNRKIGAATPPEDIEDAKKIYGPINALASSKNRDFANVAKMVSEHISASEGGDVGYLTGLSGQGFPYEYESACYTAKKGVVYGPVRSSMGYHLVHVTDVRPHVELELAHLMLLFRKNMTKEDSVALKARIDSIYGVIKGGENFEEMVKKFSSHRETIRRGGSIGWVAMSSNFPVEFKEAGFAMKNDGEISEPVMTRFGWHIIKRLGRRETPPFDSIKTDLKVKVEQDNRNNMARELMIKKIKSDYKFTEFPGALNDFYKVVDSTLPVGSWKKHKAEGLNKPMFKLANKTFSQQDFAFYLERNYRYIGRNYSIPRMVDKMYRLFVNASCLDTREEKLEEEQPEFAQLMSEYRDGILLFNLTDQKVWTKAIKDTSGAKEYHEKNKDKFMWEERLDASLYSCKDAKIADKVRKLIKKGTNDVDILKAINKDTIVNVVIENRLYLKGESAMMDEFGWNPRVTDNKDVKGKIYFANIRKIMAPKPKTYEEARGLVTSSYQSWLEQEWINSLKAKYPVSISQKVFDSIQ